MPDEIEPGYAGTLGWSGSDTSRERAEDEALSGDASFRLARTLELLDRVGSYGLTWAELADLTGWHHGQASGVLSNLHKDGRVARLADRRGRSKIYVTPDQVGGRLTERHGHNRSPAAPGVDLRPEQRLALTETLNRAREAYLAPRPFVVAQIWPTPEAYLAFWQAVAAVVRT